MYVYFDANGTLKEIISDKSFRVGDSKKDKIYVYWDGEHTPVSGWVKYRKPNGREYPDSVEECFFQFGDNLVGKPLPNKPLRNLKYFSYDHTYEENGEQKVGYLFYEITVPDEILNSSMDDEKVPSENNMVIARIRFVMDDNKNGKVDEADSIETLGALVFSVETNIGILTDSSINKTQYNYLIQLVSMKLGTNTKSVKVSQLPSTGVAGTIYYVKNTESDLIYDAYFWNGSNFVYLGTTSYGLYTKQEGDYFETAIQTLWTAEMNDYEALINEKFETYKNSLNAQMIEWGNLIQAASSGSPKDVYSTLTALQNAFPTGTNGIYVVSENGHWYYWNGSAWTDGGVYQAIEIANGSVSIEKTNFIFRDSANLIKYLSIRDSVPAGITAVIQDEFLILNGTTTNALSFNVMTNTINSGNYYCTLYNQGTSSSTGVMGFYNDSGKVYGNLNITAYNNKYMEFTSDVNRLFFYFGANTTFNNYKLKIMVSSNSIDNYESYDLFKLSEKIKVSDYKMNYIYVDNSYDENTDGYGITKFKTLFEANKSIVDNSKNNNYTIIVKKGTYNDLEAKYAGTSSGKYEGIVCKDYVYYESEDINHPEECIINWNGATGFSLPITDPQITDKCPFHITNISKHTHIKGFTFNVKNCRYAMHIETAGATSPVNYVIENCVFNWGGRPDQDTVTYPYPNVGTGFTNGNVGEFINCEFNNTGTTTYDNMIWQSHDNTNNSTGVSIGDTVKFINCYFKVNGEKAIFNPRTTINSNYKGCKINSSITFVNASGSPIEIAQSTTAKYKYHIINI